MLRSRSILMVLFLSEIWDTFQTKYGPGQTTELTGYVEYGQTAQNTGEASDNNLDTPQISDEMSELKNIFSGTITPSVVEFGSEPPIMDTTKGRKATQKVQIDDSWLDQFSTYLDNIRDVNPEASSESSEPRNIMNPAPENPTAVNELSTSDPLPSQSSETEGQLKNANPDVSKELSEPRQENEMPEQSSMESISIPLPEQALNEDNSPEGTKEIPNPVAERQPSSDEAQIDDSWLDKLSEVIDMYHDVNPEGSNESTENLQVVPESQTETGTVMATEKTIKRPSRPKTVNTADASNLGTVINDLETPQISIETPSEVNPVNFASPLSMSEVKNMAQDASLLTPTRAKLIEFLSKRQKEKQHEKKMDENVKRKQPSKRDLAGSFKVPQLPSQKPMPNPASSIDTKEKIVAIQPTHPPVYYIYQPIRIIPTQLNFNPEQSQNQAAVLLPGTSSGVYQTHSFGYPPTQGGMVDTSALANNEPVDVKDRLKKFLTREKEPIIKYRKPPPTMNAIYQERFREKVKEQGGDKLEKLRVENAWRNQKHYLKMKIQKEESKKQATTLLPPGEMSSTSTYSDVASSHGDDMSGVDERVRLGDSSSSQNLALVAQYENPSMVQTESGKTFDMPILCQNDSNDEQSTTNTKSLTISPPKKRRRMKGEKELVPMLPQSNYMENTKSSEDSEPQLDIPVESDDPNYAGVFMAHQAFLPDPAYKRGK